jgi:hypothetical protein
MTITKDTQAERAARREKIAKMWRNGVEVAEIAARMGKTKFSVQGDIADMQARGEIARRVNRRPVAHRVMRTPSFRSEDPAREAKRLYEKVDYARRLAELAASAGLAKRVVTMAERSGEMRVTKFFASPDDAETAALCTITARPHAIVTGDVIFVKAGASDGHKRWAVGKVLAGGAA